MQSCPVQPTLRPGPIGRLARLLLALSILELVWRLLIHSGPADIANPFMWVYTAIAIVLAPLLVRFGLGSAQGRSVQLAILISGLTAALWSWLTLGAYLGTATWWWMKLTMLVAFSHLGLSFALAGLFATRGMEMRAIPELLGVAASEDACEHSSVMGPIDRWEVSLRGGPD